MSDIAVRLTGENSEFRSMLNDSVERGDEAFGKLGTALEHRVVGMRHLSTALATALGLDLHSIADKAAMWFADMSKAEEEAYKKSEQLSTAAADAAIKNMRSRLTDEQKYQLAIQERDRLLREVTGVEAKGAEAQNALNEKKVELEKTISEIQAFEAKEAAKERQAFAADAAARATLNEKEHTAAMAKLSADEREKELRDEIKGIETAIALGHLDEASKKLYSAQISARQLELDKSINEERAKQKSTLQEIAKLKFDALPVEERILSFETSIETLTKMIVEGKKAHKNVDELILALAQNKGELGKLELSRTKELNAAIANTNRLLQEGVPAEENKAKIVAAELEKQIAANKEIRDAEFDRTHTENDITISLEGQNVKLQSQLDAINKVIAGIHGIYGAWVEVDSKLSRTGLSYQSQSTASLQGMQDKLNAQLNQVGSDGQQLKNATVTGNYGAWLTASTIQSELDAINKELSLRAQVVAFDQKYGDVATTREFGDTLTQRALRDMQSTQKQTANTLQAISNQLAASGLFPTVGGIVTPGGG